MKKANDVLGVATKLLSFGTVYVILMSYGTNIAYYTGYLKHFGIDISNINFWPSLFDLMIRGLAILVALVVIVALYASGLIILNFIDRVEKKLIGTADLPWMKYISSGVATSKQFIIVSSLLTLISLSFVLVFYNSYSMGLGNAATQRTFIEVNASSAQITKQLLMYQNGGVGVVKEYNPQTHKFTEGYKLIELTGKLYTTYQLR
jgi:hypothetical protein